MSAKIEKKPDLTKPVQTRKGQAVRIIATDAKDAKYPVIGLRMTEEGGESTESWTVDGIFQVGASWRDLDLVNVPEKLVRYVNFYRTGAHPWGMTYTQNATAEQAEDRSDQSSKCCIARIRVEFEEGRFDA